MRDAEVKWLTYVAEEFAVLVRQAEDGYPDGEGEDILGDDLPDHDEGADVPKDSKALLGQALV